MCVVKKLVKCEDCGKKVSINADACPKCGSLIQEQESVKKQKLENQIKQEKLEKQKLENKKMLSAIWCIIILLFVAKFVSSSILSAFILIISAILSLWFVKDFIQSKKPIKRGILNGLSVILFVIGFVIGQSAENKIWEQTLAENPELANKIAKERAERIAEKAREEADKEREQKTSKAMLLMWCEEAVKPTLKNPKSMEVDVGASEYGNVEGKPAVIMHYYAQNGFGATILGKTSCIFSDNGVLEKVKPLN